MKFDGKYGDELVIEFLEFRSFIRKIIREKYYMS